MILLLPILIYTLASSETNTYYLGARVGVPKDRPVVYMDGGDLLFEYRVIEASGLFDLSDDPATPIHLTLHPDRSERLCGMPLVLMICSCGLVPLKMPRQGVLDVSLTEDGVTTEHSYSYDCITRTSFWESFRYTDEVQELGESIRAGAQE